MGQKEVEEMLCKEFELLASLDIASQEQTYVFDIVTDNELALAASFSNHTIKILDSETLASKYTWKAHTKQITELKFSPENRCHLLSSSLDGTICLWDLRQKPERASHCFEDLSSNKHKPLSCFDISSSSRLLCGGTELIQTDAYVIFWDTRSTKLLGGYWESHTDDITQLKFHPLKEDSLISGSTDGLINLFDVSKGTEEDALISTLNTESSICKLNWMQDSEDKLACLTHTHDLKVWNALEPFPCISLTHDDFKHKANIKAPVDYLVDILKCTPTNILLMSGSFNGSTCIWDISEENFNVRNILMKGHTDVVRTCRWNEKMKMVVTGGEDGIVSVWKNIEDSNIASENKVEELAALTSKSKIKGADLTFENEIQEQNLASESKKMSLTAEQREARKFRPY